MSQGSIHPEKWKNAALNDEARAAFIHFSGRGLHSVFLNVCCIICSGLGSLASSWLLLASPGSCWFLLVPPSSWLLLAFRGFLDLGRREPGPRG